MEEDDQEMDEELVALQFNEPLSWRAGKPIATGELLRRLEKLSKELSNMEQETVDKNSLHNVAKDLASHNLLAHKEAGVKAYVAMCLVDVLKLCAPEAPFTPKQLKVGLGPPDTGTEPALMLNISGNLYTLRQGHTSCPLESIARI